MKDIELMIKGSATIREFRKVQIVESRYSMKLYGSDGAKLLIAVPWTSLLWWRETS